MKEILIQATKSSMQNECHENLTPTFFQQPLTSVDTQWQPHIHRYLTLPYTLWDPLSQFPTIFHHQLNCPLCLEEGLANPLIVSNDWQTGMSQRQQPRILFHVV